MTDKCLTLRFFFDWLFGTQDLSLFTLPEVDEGVVHEVMDYLDTAWSQYEIDSALQYQEFYSPVKQQSVMSASKVTKVSFF